MLASPDGFVNGQGPLVPWIDSEKSRFSQGI